MFHFALHAHSLPPIFAGEHDPHEVITMKARSVQISVWAGILAGALVAVAQTQVSSNNIVGYFKLTVDRGGLYMLRSDFDTGSTDLMTPTSVFGSSLPVGTEVYAWNNQTQSYSISKYSIVYSKPPVIKPIATNWSLSVEISRGKGFWLKVPTNAPESSYTIYIMGQVPTNQTETIQIAQGLNMTAYAFPSEVLWTNTALAKSATVNDEVYLWNPVSKSYSIGKYSIQYSKPPVIKAIATNWTIPTMTIPVGKSVWYKSAKPKEWTEPRPY